MDEKHEKIEGAPNFRQITGFPVSYFRTQQLVFSTLKYIVQVYGTGQPTEEGMVAILNKAKEGKDGAKVAPILFQGF